MAASGDEASLGFLVDAPYALDTSFYLMLGDNAYGYSYSSADRDAYFVKLDIGSVYTIVTADSNYYGLPVDTDFGVYSPAGVLLFLSYDYGPYSGASFTAYYSSYIIVTYSVGTGIYAIRAENNSFPEANAIGEVINADQVYSAALDYTSDSDFFTFYAEAGVVYGAAFITDIPDLFLKVVDYGNVRVDTITGSL